MAAPTHQDTRAGIIQLVRPAYQNGKPVLAPDATPQQARADDLPFDAPPRPTQSQHPTLIETLVGPTPEGRKRGQGQKGLGDETLAGTLYRAGMLTLRDVGTQSGMSHTKVVALAKEHGWTRDLSYRANKRADEKMTEDATRAARRAARAAKREAKSEARHQAMLSKPKKVSKPEKIPKPKKQKLETNSRELTIGHVSANRQTVEAMLVETISNAIVRVRSEHRTRINRANAMLDCLFAELEATQSMLPELIVLGDLLQQPDSRNIDRLGDLYRKVIEFPGRTKALTDMSNVLSTLIKLEREAWSIDSAPPDGDGGRASLPIRFVETVERADE